MAFDDREEAGGSAYGSMTGGRIAQSYDPDRPKRLLHAAAAPGS
ncbi:hypothetical protein ACWF0M_07590 [Kribbella sp. NPDC055110]